MVMVILRTTGLMHSRHLLSPCPLAASHILSLLPLPLPLHTHNGIEKNWFDTRHPLAQPMPLAACMPACQCHIVSRLCIAAHSGFDEHNLASHVFFVKLKII